MNAILSHIKKTYHPLCILVYGSYADGSNNHNSDFDCAAVVREKALAHDTSEVNGVSLDLFLYTPEEIASIADYGEYVQLYDARIELDTDGIAHRLVAGVREYVERSAKKTDAEKRDLVSWVNKMLLRAKRGDAEGNYRLRWALVDSLEIYCNLRDQYYFGPKKTILHIRRTDGEGYRLLENALSAADYQSVLPWLMHVIKTAA